MKLKYTLAALVSCALLVIPPSFAQIRPQPFTIPEALHYLDSLSRAYLERVSSRSGLQTYPTESDYIAVKVNLDMLMKWLNSAGNNRPIKPGELNDQDTKTLVNAALKCLNCKNIVQGATPDSLPMNFGQMKTLLLARLKMIQSLIPSSGRLTNDEIIQLETQITYLRTIVTAYREYEI